MGNRYFTDEELADLGRAPKDVAMEAIKAGDMEKAEKWLNIYAETHLGVHDTYRDWIATLMSYIHKHDGVEALEEVMRTVVGDYYNVALDLVKDVDFRTKVQILTSAMFGHGTPLKVEEDDEKVTFWMMPCRAGQAQIQAGDYANGRFSSVDACNITYSLPEFPVYCVHSPIQEMLSIEKLGYPVNTVTPCKDLTHEGCDKERSCAFCIYKDPKDIPEEAFTRVGFKKPEA